MPTPALKISYPDRRLKSQGFIEWAVERGLEWLDAEAANRRIVELTVENLRLQSKLDAKGIKL